MPVKREEELEEEAVVGVAKDILISARTAPKTKGIDDVKISLVYGSDLKKLAEKMKDLSESIADNFIRDAKGVESSHAVIFIGVDGEEPIGLNCGACGFDCASMKENRKKGRDFYGPLCAFKLLDMGIAVGSAVKTASILNVDNRIMYRGGLAGILLGYIEADIALGIPLAVKGKNPFFDRHPITERDFRIDNR